MLRRLQVISGKPAEATYKAGSNMVRGMLVTKDLGEGTVAAANGTDNLYFVDKTTIPTGVYSLAEYSEYDDAFEKIAEGEPVVLEKAMVGERFATNQFTGEIEEGDVLKASNGKLVAAEVNDTSQYVCGGTYVDNGKTLIVVEIVEPITVSE